MVNNILFNEVNASAKYLPSTKLQPIIHSTATIRNSNLTGDITVCENVHIVNAVIRADEGSPFYIGVGSNIQDFVVLHGYATQENDSPLLQSLVKVEGKGYYSIYIAENVSISHGVLIHGPAYIKENTFIGFKATVDGANIGSNVEIGAHSYIKNVNIPDNTAILPNAIITEDKDIEKYIIPLNGINKRILEVNQELAISYNNRKI